MDKIYYLDGLRGLACIIVVFNHFAGIFFPCLQQLNPSLNEMHPSIQFLFSLTPLNLIFAGDFAVCIFFVLSGYVLTKSYFIKNDEVYIVKSIIKRYFRLCLPITVSLFLVYFLMRYKLMQNREVALITHSFCCFYDFWQFPVSFLDVLYHSTIRVLVFGDWKYNPILWTMNIEFFGSLLAFFLAIIVKHVKNSYLILLVLSVIFINTYYLGFIFGVYLSLYSEKSIDFLKNKKPVILYFLLFIAIVLGSWPITRKPDLWYSIFELKILQNPSITYHLLGAFFVVSILLNSRTLQSILSSTFFTFLGKISFGVYLLHFPVMGSICSHLFLKLFKIFDYNISVLLSIICSMPLILLFGYLFYRIIDKPSLKISNYVYDLVFKKIK